MMIKHIFNRRSASDPCLQRRNGVRMFATENTSTDLPPPPPPPPPPSASNHPTSDSLSSDEEAYNISNINVKPWFPPSPKTMEGRDTSSSSTSSSTTFSSSPRSRLSSVTLAYLGDSIYEMYVRRHFLFPPLRVEEYHKRTVNAVRAETQAAIYDILTATAPQQVEAAEGGKDPQLGTSPQPSKKAKMTDTFTLTGEEREVLKWGLNSQVQPPARLRKIPGATLLYRKATAVECLTGYLYLASSSSSSSSHDRLHDFLSTCMTLTLSKTPLD